MASYDQENVNYQGTFLPGYQEKYLKDLLANVYSTDADGNATGIAATSPLGGVAEADTMDFTPNQLEAIRMARAGIGAYEPMMRQAEASFGDASGALGSGLSALGGTMGGFDLSGYAGDVREGQEGLRGTTEAFDPESVSAYMNPYEDAAVQQAMADIGLAGEERRVGLGASAGAAGALGGSRQAIESGMLSRDILGQQGRTAAGMRQAGFESAAGRAQSAFEQLQARRGAAATGIVNMGSDLANKGMSAFENQMNRGQQASQIFGQLGEGIAGVGAKQAALGDMAQKNAATDVNSLYNIGSLEQQQQQREYDVQRQNQMEMAYEPFKRFGFMSDMFRGVPSTSTSLGGVNVPSPSPMNSIVGNAQGLGQYQNFSGYS